MLGWFVETMLVASGLAVVAAAASRIRSIGPTARHVMWLLVLVRLMTPPVVAWPWAVHRGGLNWPFISASAARVAPSDQADIASRRRRCDSPSRARSRISTARRAPALPRPTSESRPW